MSSEEKTIKKWDVERYIPPINLQNGQPPEGEWWSFGNGYSTLESAREAALGTGKRKSRIVEVTITRKVVEE